MEVVLRKIHCKSIADATDEEIARILWTLRCSFNNSADKMKAIEEYRKNHASGVMLFQYGHFLGYSENGTNFFNCVGYMVCEEKRPIFNFNWLHKVPLLKTAFNW